MNFEASGSGFADLVDNVEKTTAKAITAAMGDVGDGAKADWRAQLISAGLSTRLANTVRRQVYPQRTTSMEAAVVISSKAPKIMASLSQELTIVPINGAKFLAIPTDNVPNARNPKGGYGPMTVEQVENHFNQDLTILKGKSGHWLGFINAVQAKNKRGWRAATKGRVAQGRKAELRLMFTFVPSVRTRKRLDLDVIANKWAAQVDAAIETRLGLD